MRNMVRQNNVNIKEKSAKEKELYKICIQRLEKKKEKNVHFKKEDPFLYLHEMVNTYSKYI